jgi:hypothetical protein
MPVMRADILSDSLIACPAPLRQARRADMSRSAFIGLVAAWTINASGRPRHIGLHSSDHLGEDG